MAAVEPDPALPLASSGGRIVFLDGLRGVAIAIVVLSHAWLWNWIPGGLGVTLFFFISGYIITKLLLDEYARSGQIDIKAFFVRRARRLLPALSVYLLIATLFSWYHYGVRTLLECLSVIFYFSNYLFIYASTLTDPSFFSITWSLSIEEHFYFLYPFAFVGLVRMPPRRAIQLLAILLLAILLWRCYLVWGVGIMHLEGGRARIYKGSDTRIDSILFGVCCAFMQNGLASGEKSGVLRVLLAGGKIQGGVALLLLCASVVIRTAEFLESVRYSLQGMAVLLLFGVFFKERGFFFRVLSWSFWRSLGAISYSLYLYHWMAFVLIELYLEALPIWQKQVLMLCSTWLTAFFSYHWVESAFSAKARARV